MSGYSQAASGLSALGRASEHALSEQAVRPPSPQSARSGADGTGTRPGLAGLGAIGAGRSSQGRGAGHLSFQPRRPRRTWSRAERGLRRSGRGLHTARRSRSLTSIAFRFFLAVVVLAVLGGVYAVIQLTRSVPQPVLRPTSTLPAAVVLPGPRPALPWPGQGQAAVALAGFGVLGSAGPARPVPIASLTKVMTALVVLRDHPLRAGETGPSVRITSGDEALYRAQSAVGDSVAPVAAGEQFSQVELLEMLLIPSADNVAPVLARWDAGSETAFVAKMNALASMLGMGATHYADTNGLSTATVGTALDQLKLAETASGNPVLMSIVRQPVITLPNGTTLRNYDTLLGRSGVIGIKTGSTTAAGGCFMLAAQGVAKGRNVEVLAVVLGQHSSPLIDAALQASEALVRPALSALRAVTVVPAGTSVAQVVSKWAAPVPVKTTRAVTVVGVPGMTVHLAVKLTSSPQATLSRAGSPLASVTASAGAQVVSVPAVTNTGVPKAPLHWRLKRL
jgi:D-alanyl-D-alanine carboxypeptidase (penicillin-binding protein 5/6)